MFGWFKKEIPAPARFPERDNVLAWMRERVAYYRSVFGDEAWQLFSPYFASYMPISIDAGFSFNDEAQRLYRLVKEENADLVEKAIASRPEGGYSIFISRVGDPLDFDFNIRLLP